MIYERFGKWWWRFSLFDLLLVNFLTLVTEFAAISLATQQMGISPNLSVPIAAVALVIYVILGTYRRWERITCILCLLDSCVMGSLFQWEWDGNRACCTTPPRPF